MDLLWRTRVNADFYCLLGPFFGSRAIAKALGMPMYDDPDRIWCLICAPTGPAIACASIALCRSHGVFKSAWVDPEWRDQGLYHQLFAARLAYAQEHHITKLTSTATMMSCHTHKRFGFTLVGRRGQYYQFQKEITNDHC